MQSFSGLDLSTHITQLMTTFNPHSSGSGDLFCSPRTPTSTHMRERRRQRQMEGGTHTHTDTHIQIKIKMTLRTEMTAPGPCARAEAEAEWYAGFLTLPQNRLSRVTPHGTYQKHRHAQRGGQQEQLTAAWRNRDQCPRPLLTLAQH